MKVLLDTHTLLWALRSPDRLSATAGNLIRDPHVELVVSAITPFEIATKSHIGKLPGVEPILAAYSDYLSRIRVTELAVTSHHGLVAGQLDWDHRDPFDRILAAQSITESLPLVTSDAVFGTLGGIRVIWE